MRARALLYPAGNDENSYKNVKAKTKEIEAQEATVGCCTEMFARFLTEGIPQNSREKLRTMQARLCAEVLERETVKRNYGQSEPLEGERYRSDPFVMQAK
jgi:hypothetical protein